MTAQYRNRVESVLLMDISASTTLLRVPVADGMKFPAASSDDFLPMTPWFPLVLENDAGDFEIVHVQSHVTDSGDMSAQDFTVARGCEGTTARAWPAGTRVMLALTAKAVEEMQLHAAEDFSDMATKTWVQDYIASLDGNNIGY